MSNYYVYRISDENGVFYVGRTDQNINERMRQHMTSARSDVPHIDPRIVKKIEYAECKTEADMYVYEVYYINLMQPRMNEDAKAVDWLTVWLPELDWRVFKPSNLKQWQAQYMTQELDRKEKDQRHSRAEELANEYKRKYLTGQISFEDYTALTNQLWQQIALMN